LFFSPDSREVGYDSIIDLGEPGIWRFWRILPPIDSRYRVSLGEGLTFLHKADRLGRNLGLVNLYLKNETTNPSGSFMDRGVAVEVARALELGFTKLACFSRGNLGVSTSAYAAKTGLECLVYAPPNIERVKLYQIIAYDAKIVFRENLSPREERAIVGEGTYFLSLTSPYFLSGLKTLAYEIFTQLGHDHKHEQSIVIIPVGEGGNITMFWQGVREMIRLGILDRGEAPKLVAVQSEGCMPIVEAFKRRRRTVRWNREVKTFFQDIASPTPAMGEHAVRAIRESNGTAVSVSDDDIIEATRTLAKNEGILAEPAAASTIAALRKLAENRTIDRDEVIICIITGSGLKEPTITQQPTRFQRTVVARSRRLSRIGMTKVLILKLLYERPMHGYEIRRKLAEIHGVRISTASIYQHLTELVDSGLVEQIPTQQSTGTRVRKTYTLTTLGRRTASQIL